MWSKLLLRQKITWMVMAVCALMLLLFEGVFLKTQQATLQGQAQRSLDGLAAMIAYGSAAPLTFDDVDGGNQTLKALASVPEVVQATVRHADGRVFAGYAGSAAADQGGMSASAIVRQKGVAIGKVELRATLRYVDQALYQAMLVAGIAGLLLLMLAAYVARLSAQRLSAPLLKLAALANAVGQDGDYSVRAPDSGAADEAGQLGRRFNQMLEQVQTRDLELAGHRDHLEQEVARRTADLVRARDAAEAASRAKSEFLAMMSHEIRTPLNGVLGMTDLLANTELDDRQRRFVRIVRRSGEDLLAILNDILDFSKIEAGRFELDDCAFNLTLVMENVAERYAPVAHGKGLELSCAAPLRALMLRGDAKRLGQVLTNLVSNAIKFTERGQVVLRAEVTDSPDDSAEILFTVTDTGIGIPAAKQAGLFEAFTQADSSTTRRFGGTGLGLAISQRLVGLMGSAITLRSEEDQGSEFRFTVRLPRCETGPDVADTMLAPMRVLIVDDNQVNLEILAEQLHSWGCQVVQAHNVQGARVELGRSGAPFELVVTDMMMPDEDGAGLVEYMQQQPHLAAIPVIMLSSAGMQWHGASGGPVPQVLTKPVRQSELYNALCHALRASQGGAAQRAAGSAARGRVLKLHGRVLLAEDNLANQEVALAMLRNLGVAAEVAANGVDVISLLERRQFDLILMDCQMPVMDGFQATAAIRAAEGPEKHLPIVALTANAVAGDRQRCIDSGMDEYLSKPFTQDQLGDMLRRWLQAVHVGPRDEALAAPAASADVVAPAGGGDGIDSHALDTIRQLRPGLLLRVLNAWMLESPGLYQDMVEAAAQGDGAALFRAAHTLKNSSANVGARQLSQLCAELEQRGRHGQLDEVGDAIAELAQYFERALSELSAIRDREQ